MSLRETTPALIRTFWPTRGQAHETVMLVEVREWIRPAPASPDLVLVAQPIAARSLRIAPTRVDCEASLYQFAFIMLIKELLC